MTPEELLRKHYQDIYRRAAQYYTDTGEQLKVGYAAPMGMETGFLTGEQRRLSSEYGEYIKGLREQEKTQMQIMAEQKKQQEAAARKQKISNFLKGATGLVGGLLTATGIGAPIGGAIAAAGQLGGSLIGGEAPQFDFGFIDEWKTGNQLPDWKFGGGYFKGGGGVGPRGQFDF